jgi:hypothetical protein
MFQQQQQISQRYLARLVSSIVLGLTLGLSLAFAQPPEPEVAPNPDELYFRDEITYGGTGCPQGSLSAAVSEDGLAVTLTFDSYFAEVSAETPPVVRQFCNVNLPMNIPSGWQYSLVELDYRGYLFLDPRVEARQTSEYYFQGNQGPSFSSFWTGPQNRDFNFSDLIGIESHNWAWSECNTQRHLTIKTSMVLNNRRNRSGYGYISTDSIDAEIAHVYSILWRQCGGSQEHGILQLDR